MKVIEDLPELSVDLLGAAQRSRGPLSALSPSFLKGMEEDYRRFLSLAKSNPEKMLVPSYPIDEMWHLHMLHPLAYQQDCQAFFGRILDHNPAGDPVGEVLQGLEDAFSQTAILWKKHFGTDYALGEPLEWDSIQSYVKPPCTTEPVPTEPEPEAPQPEPEPSPEPGPESSRHAA